MNVKKFIPNTITCMNLVSGCISSVMALQGNLQWALVWILLAAVFDFFDGLAARALHAYSPIGKELDSLADIVSFGVAPGMMLFISLNTAVGSLASDVYIVGYLPYLAFIIPAFSGLRLAKFNIDERQVSSFIGLPVPAHALFWGASLFTVQPFIPAHAMLFVVTSVVVAFLLSLLLVSKVPMFSFKVKNLAWKGNEVRYVFVSCALVLIILLGFLGLAVTILLYILLSIFMYRKQADNH